MSTNKQYFGFNQKIIDNFLSMMKYRKYESVNQNDYQFEGKIDNLLFFSDKNDELVCVKFISNLEKLNVDNIRLFICFLTKNEIFHGIIVCKNEPSKQILKEIYGLQINFEIFYAGQLNYDIMQHMLVSEHILLSDTEKNQVKRDFQAAFSLFPKIKEDDIMSRYIGAKAGDLILIKKKDKTVNYRFVIT